MDGQSLDLARCLYGRPRGRVASRRQSMHQVFTKTHANVLIRRLLRRDADLQRFAVCRSRKAFLPTVFAMLGCLAARRMFGSVMITIL